MKILSMSIAGSLIILAVMVIRAFFKYKLPKRAFLALWGIAVYRLLIPFSIPSRLNIWYIVDMLIEKLLKPVAISEPTPLANTISNATSGTLLASATDTVISDSAVIAVDSGAQASSAVSPSLFFWIWLAGTCVLALYFLFTHWRCQNIYKTALPLKNSFIEQWLKARPLRRTISVRQSDKISTQLIYGIIKPVIVFPTLPDWHNETCLSHILTHEYTHIRRFDTLLEWVLAATLCLHWFNPLVWLMYIYANRDIELSCDETVLRSCGEQLKTVYALILIGLEEKRSRLLNLYSNFSKNAAEERVLSIMKFKKYSKISIMATFVLAASLISLFATSKAEPPAIVIAAGKADYSGYIEKMLYVSKGETPLKVTYDAKTWAPYTPILENENWIWFTHEEYMDHIKCALGAKNFRTEVEQFIRSHLRLRIRNRQS